MRKKEKRTVSIEREEIVEVRCDHCDKLIYRKLSEVEEALSRPQVRKTILHYEVATYHHDWGENSSDSFEYLDICSMNCLSEHMKEYFDGARGTEEYNIKRVEHTCLHEELEESPERLKKEEQDRTLEQIINANPYLRYVPDDYRDKLLAEYDKTSIPMIQENISGDIQIQVDVDYHIR
jgi:hypothetical protein